MFTVTDHLGRLLSFKETPQRIISLVPSQTELLVDLRLRENIQGITKFCIHPSSLKNEKTIVGGTKNIHLEKIKALRPDIILCNKEENTQEIVTDLMSIAPVHISDIDNVEKAINLVSDYGKIFDREVEATTITQKVQRARKFFTNKAVPSNRKVAYLIWKNPFMVAGRDTFINTLLKELGFINPFENLEERYPMITIDDLKDIDEIFLSTEPYPFSQKHLRDIKSHLDARVTIVNGEYFSWYGSRLIKAYPYFEKLLKELEL